MPDPELKTIISLDTGQADQQMDQLTVKAQQVRMKEFMEQESLVQELTSLSVEEFDKQIKAQEQLLEQLRLKQENVADEDRQQLVRNFSERRQEHEVRLRELDEEMEKISADHATKVEQLERVKQIKADDDASVMQRAETIKTLETEVAEVVDRSRTNYLEKTKVAHALEQDRLETLRALSGQAQQEGGGGAGGGTGIGDVAEVGALGLASARAGAAFLSPALRLLGIGAVALSLEQVVAKLISANEELRVIRSNYADIAASMGDLVGVGGVVFGAAQSALRETQRDIFLEFGTGVDERIFPQLVRTLSRGGFQPEALAGMGRRTLFGGIGAGTDPQSIAQLQVRLFREFRVPMDLLEAETALLIQVSQDLRIPFEDLTKWTITLAEQTRIYGFDVDDSRRIVTAFAKELDEGTVQIQDLVKAQRSLGDLGLSEGGAFVQFLGPISRAAEQLGLSGFERMVQQIGPGEEQARFFQALGQGEVLRTTLETAGPGQREAIEQFFDPETLRLRPQFANINQTLEEARRVVTLEMARGMGEDIGGFAIAAIDLQLRALLGEDVTNLSNRTINALDQNRDEVIGVREVIGDQTETANEFYDKLIEQGEKRAKLDASLTSAITTAIKSGWRDVAEAIGLSLARLFGDERADVEAQAKTIIGERVLGAAGIAGGEGLEAALEGVGTLSADELRKIFGAGGGALRPGEGRRGREIMLDLLKALVASGGVSLGQRSTRELAEKLFSGVPEFGPPPPTGLEFLAQRGGIDPITSVLGTLGRLPRQLIGDVNPDKPGLQVNLGGVEINVTGGEFEQLRDELNREIVEPIIEMFKQANEDPGR